jgi:hypothetical protein
VKRLLFIGNSHLGAVKASWDSKPPSGFEAEFFAAPQRSWLRMGLMADAHFGLGGKGYPQHRKITQNLNGKVAVSLRDRDVIVQVGGFNAADPLAAFLTECDIAGLRETGAATLLSSEFFTMACLEMAHSMLPEAGWHHRNDAAVVVMPRPASCETCLTSTYSGYQPWHRLAANPSGISAVLNKFDGTLSSVFAEKGLTYLPQPAQTRTPVGLTAARYLLPDGGTQPGEEGKRGDHAHMNLNYGAECINSLLTWLHNNN